MLEPTAPVIRLASLGDLDAIRAIYNHFVLTSTCTFQIEPLTKEEHRRWFLDRSPAHPVTVAEIADEAAGWGALSAWKPRGAYAHTTEASVYVRHDLHRRGLGRALLADLIDRAKAVGHHTILGGTCAEQVPSIELQKSMGFREVGRLAEVGRKFDRWLDVVYMQLMLA